MFAKKIESHYKIVAIDLDSPRRGSLHEINGKSQVKKLASDQKKLSNSIWHNVNGS